MLVETSSTRRSAPPHPIHKVPSHLLRYIFFIATNHDTPLLIALHDAFQPWGDLILSSPSLWRQIDVELDRPSCLSMLEISLLLSRNALLIVDIQGDGDLQDVFAALSPHWARISHFKLISPPSRLTISVGDREEVLFALNVTSKRTGRILSLPFSVTLTTLHLSPTFDTNTASLLSSVPRLTSLHLDDIHGCSPDTASLDLFSLESLNLQIADPNPIHSIYFMDSIACPNLRSLNVRWATGAPLRSFLHCMAWTGRI